MIPHTAGGGAPAGASGLLLAGLPAGMIVGNFAIGRYLRPVWRQRLTLPLMLLLSAPLVALTVPLPLPLVAVLLV